MKEKKSYFQKMQEASIKERAILEKKNTPKEIYFRKTQLGLFLILVFLVCLVPVAIIEIYSNVMAAYFGLPAFLAAYYLSEFWAKKKASEHFDAK